MKNIFPILALAFVAASCEKTLTDYELPYGGDQLSMHGFVTVGDSVDIVLGESSAALDSDGPDSRSSYTAVLLENDIVVDTLEAYLAGEFYTSRGVFKDLYRYRGDYRAVANKTYSVQVSDSRLESISAQIRTYSPPTVRLVSADTAQQRYTIEIEDEGGDNYYQIHVIYKEGVNGEEFVTYMSFTDPTVQTFGEYEDPFDESPERFASYVYFQNTRFAGGIKRFEFFTGHSGSNNGRAIVVVSRIGEQTYKYFQTLGAYYMADGVFSENVQVYSNVENGYGLLGSYAPSRIDLPF